MDKKGNFKEDILNLRNFLIEQGYLNPCFKLSFIYFVETLIFLMLGFIFVNYNVIIGSFFLGIFFLKAGWFSHDVLHGQTIRENKKWVNFIHYLVGGYQGLSHKWWTLKHNRHHISPNSYKQEKGKYVGVDTDINTEPVLHWSEKFINYENNNWLYKFNLKNQHYTFLIVIIFLRVYWIFQSYKFDIKNKKYLSFFINTVHYLLFFTILNLMNISLMNSFIFLLLGNLIGGTLIGLTVVAHHFGFEPYEYDDNKYWNTANSTRNIKDSWLINFVMCGLQYHIEHHMFHTLPRKHLKEVSNYIKAIYHKNDMIYHEVTWYESIKIVFNHLKNIGMEYKENVNSKVK